MSSTENKNETPCPCPCPCPSCPLEEQERGAVEEVLIPLWDGFQYFTHQVEGIRWMLEKERVGTSVPNRKISGSVVVRGGLQCDEMGLGKTIQVVGVMVNHLQPITVLLAPLAMLDTWAEVCHRAGFTIYQPAGCQWYRAKEGSRKEMVYVANFEKLYTTPRLFRGLKVDRVVLDEAHKIRNPDGQMAIYARRLVAPLRWGVTGTPLVNGWKDVVSLLAFLGVPCSPLWTWEKNLTEALGKIVLHRSMEALRSSLPDAPPYPLVERIRLPFLTEEERAFYLGVQNTESIGMEMDHLSSQEAFLLILRLRQISVHPQVYIQAKRRENKRYPRKDWVGPSTKVAALGQILIQDQTTAQGDAKGVKGAKGKEEDEVHKYIVFCQFREEMALLREYLLTLDLFAPENILEYDGSLTQEERERVLALSKRSTAPTVLLLQLQAGGVGLNLQEYDRIFFMSPWWTSALMDQAVARAVRMGQKRVVRVYHLELEVEETEQSAVFIDHLIDQKAEEKRALLQELFAFCDSLRLEEVEEVMDEEVMEEVEEVKVEEEIMEPGQV